MDKPEMHAILGKNTRTNKKISNTDLTKDPEWGLNQIRVKGKQFLS